MNTTSISTSIPVPISASIPVPVKVPTGTLAIPVSKSESNLPLHVNPNGDLKNVEMVKKYKLLYFVINNLSIIPSVSATISIMIVTDSGNLYRNVFMMHSIYVKWQDDNFPYEFIKAYLNDIFLEKEIVDTIDF
jgi:hypothetical protein